MDKYPTDDLKWPSPDVTGVTWAWMSYDIYHTFSINFEMPLFHQSDNECYLIQGIIGIYLGPSNDPAQTDLTIDASVRDKPQSEYCLKIHLQAAAAAAEANRCSLVSQLVQ